MGSNPNHVHLVPSNFSDLRTGVVQCAMPSRLYPTGTLTLLFTDIEGSTKLWEAHPKTMRTSLARHDALMREAIANANGYVFKTIGDAFCAAFTTAPEAVDAVLNAQLALAAEPWPSETPIKVRMALHTGAVESRDDDYFGPPVNRVARLLGTAHGGQSVLSQPTYELVRDALPPQTSVKDLGAHQLKDLARPEQIYQLVNPILPAEFAPLRSLSTYLNNLPQQLTSFIGREKETEDIKVLLTRNRLVTLTGTGGTGKTRLSLQVGADVLDHYADGVWFVELAPLDDPSLVTTAVCDALAIKEQAGELILSTLIGFLKDKKLLVVLDNCEHLVASCAKLVHEILLKCPDVQVLASSREALGIPGEQSYRVPSLSLPDPKQVQTAESMSQYESVSLFVDRAILARPDFQVTNQNAPALASVCQRLDGIPLAIELAAARVRSLSLELIDSKLDQRFRLLTGGSRTALARQQTLKALVDWSYDLLNDAEKSMLCRLSVFAGGWTVEAAEAVCAGDLIEEWKVVDLLTSLCDKSLVVSEEQDGSSRYRLLETVRQYAKDRLLDQGDAERFRGAHLAYFIAMSEDAKVHINLTSGAEWRRNLKENFENIRAAYEHACVTSGDSASRLVSNLMDFWRNQAPTEGREWAARALALPCERQSSRVEALVVAGHLASDQSDHKSAFIFLDEALRIAEELNDAELIAIVRFNLGGPLFDLGQLELAAEHYSAALEHFEQTNNKRKIAASKGNLGSVLHASANFEAALGLWEEALMVHREVGNLQGLSATLGNIANVKYDDGDYVTARNYKEEGLVLCREYGWVWGAAGCLVTLADINILEGDHSTARAQISEALQTFKQVWVPSGIADALHVFAKLAVVEGLFERATVLYGAADLIQETTESGDHGHEQEAGIVKSRAILGESAFAIAWGIGRAMSPEEAVDLALEATSGGTTTAFISGGRNRAEL